MARIDGRAPDQLRPVEIVRDYTTFAAGSALIRVGRTVVLCTASVADDVPRWMRGSGRGWVTAEYSMLPGASAERIPREAARGRQSGRTQEIQRLIGRSLRAVTDLEVMGEAQVNLDCDVLQADGGTRTASICGAFVALHDACTRLVAAGRMAANPLREAAAAVSVGMVDGTPLLDLAYSEDSRAEVDMNVVMTASGRFVEVQGTAEASPFERDDLDALLGLARSGIETLLAAQEEILFRPATGEQMSFVLATANPDKAQEILEILGSAVEVVARPAGVPDVDETGETLEDNARLKAAALVSATGRASIADDTGLEVDALGGAPGVYSARYAGEDATYDDNVAKLLAALGGVPEAERTARFRTVAIARWPDGHEVVCEGVVAGRIAGARRGERGFGYDPVFVPDEGDGRTFAEMAAPAKHAVSHRGRAFRALAGALGPPGSEVPEPPASIDR